MLTASTYARSVAADHRDRPSSRTRPTADSGASRAFRRSAGDAAESLIGNEQQLDADVDAESRYTAAIER
jgi:hypothetical protein